MLKFLFVTMFRGTPTQPGSPCSFFYSRIGVSSDVVSWSSFASKAISKAACGFKLSTNTSTWKAGEPVASLTCEGGWKWARTASPSLTSWASWLQSYCDSIGSSEKERTTSPVPSGQWTGRMRILLKPVPEAGLPLHHLSEVNITAVAQG